MINKSLSVVEPDVLNENMLLIHEFLRSSYTQAKKHVQEGIHVFKEELRGLVNTAETCFDRVMMPVNSFLKDRTQIDSEFEQQVLAGGETIPAPASQLLARSTVLEENY